MEFLEIGLRSGGENADTRMRILKAALGFLVGKI